MKLVYFQNFPPFSWSYGSEPIKGILIDLLNEALTKRMGIPLQHTGLPWARAQSLVKMNEADAYCTIVTPERLTYAECSQKSVVNTNMVVVTRMDHPKIQQLRAIQNINDLGQLKIGSYLGSGWAAQRIADRNVTWTRTLEQSLKMVAQGRVDMSINVEIVARYYIKELGLADQLILLNPVDQANFHLFIGKESRFVGILPEFDRTVAAMLADGTTQKIYDSYLNS